MKLKHYRVDAAMEIAEEYLSNDKLNTIGIVTMQMLMQASKEPTWKQYIEESGSDGHGNRGAGGSRN